MSLLDPRTLRRFLLLYGPPLAVGLVARLWNLHRQVMGGDELHAVRVALGTPLREIFYTYLPTDHSIPLAALYRLAMDLGLVLGEAHFRLPPILAGAALLALAPPWIERRIGGRLGRNAAVLFSWWLALSPGLVLYSRIVRSYMPIVLLGAVCCAALLHWWEEPRRRWPAGVLYVAAAALAVWFHLLAAPFVLAPGLFALGDLVTARRGALRQRLPALVALGLAIAGALALVLLPALDTIRTVAGDRTWEGRLDPATAFATLALHAGHRWAPLVVLFWALAALGCRRLIRARPRLGWLALTVVLAHLAGVILVLAPYGVQRPLLLHRYLVIVQPVLLLWIAVSLAGGREDGDPQRKPPAWRRWTPAALLALFTFTGPLASYDFLAGSFSHHNEVMESFRALPALEGDALPEVYRRLPEPGALIEVPWPTIWDRGHAIPAYQRLHRRPVLVSGPRQELDDPRLDLRNRVRARPKAWLGSPARYLVLHRDLAAEEARIPTASLRRPQAPGLERSTRLLQRRLRNAFGRPHWRSEQIWVWDLERVREKRREAAAR